MDKKNKILYAALIGATLAIIFITGATIFSELYKPFKNWLKEVFIHHWIGKGAIATIIFIITIAISPYLPIKKSNQDLAKMINILVAVTLVGFIAIVGFFLFETFHQ